MVIKKYPLLLSLIAACFLGSHPMSAHAAAGENCQIDITTAVPQGVDWRSVFKVVADDGSVWQRAIVNTPDAPDELLVKEGEQSVLSITAQPGEPVMVFIFERSEDADGHLRHPAYEGTCFDAGIADENGFVKFPIHHRFTTGLIGHNIMIDAFTEQERSRDAQFEDYTKQRFLIGTFFLPKEVRVRLDVPKNITQSPGAATPVTGGSPFSPNDKWCPATQVLSENATCSCSATSAVACPTAYNPTSSCPPDSNIPIPLLLRSERGEKQYYCVRLTILSDPASVLNKPPISKLSVPEGCFRACIGKPVVYLYPEKPTYVDVAVETPGEIFVSDPLYPQGGWKNVLAHPDGSLLYQGNTYRELFYEVSLDQSIAQPETGLVIAREDLKPMLRSAITRLGLIGAEQEEFLDYWLPLLRAQNRPYILFSLLPPPAKEAVDRLVVSPEPDTRIEFIAFFKPLAQAIDIPPLQLPETPPKRIGFTEVEWAEHSSDKGTQIGGRRTKVRNPEYGWINDFSKSIHRLREPIY